MMEQSPVLIISHDVVGSKMAGPGIRYWELARVLARSVPVVLATPNVAQMPDVGVRLWAYQPGVWDSLVPVVEKAQAILLCGDVLAWFPMLEQSGIPLIVDGYDPHTLETLALFAGLPEQAQRHQERERILQMQCRAGDFFICASERQRDWWLGLLEATGRINVHTYNADPSLRQLLDVVPFGLPSSPPQHTMQVLKGVWPGIGLHDKVVLWGGGLWQWLDPLTAIKAMARVREQRDDVRLVFPGTRHPNASVPEMPMAQKARELAEALGLLGTYVFFGDWVAYDAWPNYLLEADVGLSLHFDTLETRMAFRGRVLDYVWAGLPMVVTGGDATSELTAHYNIGVVVNYEDAAGVAEAILALLDPARTNQSAQFVLAQAAMTWEQAVQPLLKFCREARFAADRRRNHELSGGSNMQQPDHSASFVDELRQQITTLEWYHSIDLGDGIVTPGYYDHRPYLGYYGIPANLTGRTVLDVGAASGFFAFEMERRGAQVTAVDLPAWFAHDFGPCYQPDQSVGEGERYLHQPFLMAKKILNSTVEKMEMSVYDLDPEKVGMFDLVFCGSLLLHLTDPIRALWRLQRVTREAALIATVIHLDGQAEPLAEFVGHHHGDGWWFPNRACFEMMVKSAGFVGWEWYSDFQLDYRDGSPGPYHGVIRAWNTSAKPAWLDVVSPPLPLLDVGRVRSTPVSVGTSQALRERDVEIARLQALVAGYERGRVMRLMRWVQQGLRKRV